eukprot:scpid60602/ scgid11498/ 
MKRMAGQSIGAALSCSLLHQSLLLLPSLLCVIVSLTATATATVYHAYPDPSCEKPALVDQGNLCTVGGKSFSECISSLKVAGDECRLHAGRYPFRGDPLPVRGLHGTEEKPFVIAAAVGEEADVLLDGTVSVAADNDWDVYTFHSQIYMAPAQIHFWQMFVDGEMQTVARWPDALWRDRSVFNASNWAHSTNTSNATAGIMVDDRTHDYGVPFNSMDIIGAVVVLNTGSFETYTSTVISHEQLYATFTYNITERAGERHDDPSDDRYYLEGNFDFLDQPSEWLYDRVKNLTYLISGDGSYPGIHKITGKVSTYALNFTNCSYVQLANLTFFATTIWASSVAEHPLPTFIDHLTISSVTFTYPSTSKRVLRDLSPPLSTLISSRFYQPDSSDIMVRNVDTDLEKWFAGGDDRDHGFHAVYNSTWMYTDGPALNVQGKNCNINNNYFAYNDWSGADQDKATGGTGTINNQRGSGDLFVRNTLYKNGAMTGYQPPVASTIAFNRISGQCWGDIQHDGAGIQVQTPYQTHTTLSYNWVHDSVKYGIRFDGQPPRVGTSATLSNNVAWHCGGLMVKGDNHTVEHNMAFDLYKDVATAVAAQNCSICVLGYVRDNPGPMNKLTTTDHNVADFINGGTGNGGQSKVKKVEPLPGFASANVQADIWEGVLDAVNYDFRPHKNSSFFKYGGVGPYILAGDRWTQYLIPGRQSY